MSRLLAVACGLSLLLAAGPARAEGALAPVGLEALLKQQEGTPVVPVPGGVAVDVQGSTLVLLPGPAEVVELDLEADSPMLVSWATPVGRRFRPFGPPWRYAKVPRAPGTLRLDLRIADAWTARGRAALVFTGAGRVVIHALRARAPSGDGADTKARYDRALLLAPESVGHTTINLLTAPYWSTLRAIPLSDVVAAGAVVAFLAVLAGLRLRRRALRPVPALAAAALFALAAWDAHLLVRFVPMANLAVRPDPEARIRDGYGFAPDVGALAALAREKLRPTDRVAVLGLPNDWFAPQTLCFNLFPRRCGIMRPGDAEIRGISDLGRLRPDEVDAIVSYRGGGLPDGFVLVGAVNGQAFVARRSP